VFSPHDIRVIKSRKKKWAGYVARMERINIYNIFGKKPEGNRLLGIITQMLKE
jgi:hypothetical protein